MRHADSLRIALLKLRQRWGRALFAVATLTIALIPPILVLDLYDGARSVIVSSAKARGQDPRTLWVWRTTKFFNNTIAMTDEDRKRIRSLQGLVDQQAPLRFYNAFLRLDDGEIIQEMIGARPKFVRHLLPPGQLFEPAGDVVPVLLGTLSLRYRLSLQGKTERVDRDPRTLIGQTFEIHVGDILQRLRGRVRQRDLEKGGYRLATESEWHEQAELIRAHWSLRSDMEKLETLVVTARVVGIRPGWGMTLPYEAVRRFKIWLQKRNEAASTLARLKPARPKKQKRTQARQLGLLFETEAAAIQATEALKAAGLKVSSYHESVRRSLEQVRLAVYIVGGIVGMVLLLACFLVSSLLARVILDATREIGLLRALGARQGHVLRIYMYEAVLLCALGSLLGMIIGNVAAAGISSWVLETAAKQPTSFSFMGRSISFYQIDLLPPSLWRFAPSQLLWIGFAVSLALVSAWLPARRSARLDPIHALRIE